VTDSSATERLAVLRILTGGYATLFLIVRSRSFWQGAQLPSSRVEGVGVLWFLDERWPPLSMHVFFVVTVVLGVLFTLGWRFRLSGPMFAFAFLVIATYRMSFGHVIHTEHLVALHLLVVGFSPAADAWRCGSHHRPITNTSAHDAAIRLMIWLVAITYVLAGLAKIRHGGWDWLQGDVLRNHIAYDNLRKELLGSPHSPIGGWLVRFDWLFPPAAVATTAVELSAALLPFGGPRLRTIWAFAAWGFHIVVLMTMAIDFPYPVTGIAFAPLFAVEVPMRRIVEHTRLRFGRARVST
jgi:hypothetical protein